MKRSIPAAAALVATASLVLSACSGGGSDDPEPTGSDTGGAPTTSAAAEAPELTGPIEVWVMGNKGPAMEAVAKGFTDQTGVEVSVQAIPWGDVRAKMSTAIASGEGPDVLQVGLDRIAEWAVAGGLLDLTGKLDAYPELDLDNFFPASAATTEFDGGTYSVPWISDTRVLFYRTDLFEEAGIEAPPTTWDEWLETASTLAARGDGQYGMGMNVNDVNVPLILTWSSGGDIVVDGAIDFETPEFQQAVEFQHQFYADGLTPQRALPDEDMIAGFKDGSIPMFVSGPYMSRNLASQAPELSGKWSLAPIPGNESATSLMAGSNLGVFAFTEHEASALAFIAYLDSQDIQLAWNSTTFDLPAVTSALELLVGTEANQVYFDQMQDAKIIPIVEDWGAIMQEVNRAIEQINVGGADVEDTIAALNATVAAL